MKIKNLDLYKRYDIFNNTTCFILNMAADRLIQTKKNKKLKNEDISIDNTAYISKICNKKVTDRNTYLYTYTVLFNMKKSLNYNSFGEIIFGNKYEQKLYGSELFYNLINDFLLQKSEEFKDMNNLIEDCLMEYYQYAKSSFVLLVDKEEEYINDPIFLSDKYEIFKSYLDSSYDYFLAKKNAIALLYSEIEEEFLEKLYKFSQQFEEDGTKKIYREFNKLVTSLKPIFQSKLNKPITGKNLFDILYMNFNDILKLENERFYKKESLSIESFHYNDDSYFEIPYKDKLNNLIIDLKYLDEKIKYQDKLISDVYKLRFPDTKNIDDIEYKLGDLILVSKWDKNCYVKN